MPDDRQAKLKALKNALATGELDTAANLLGTQRTADPPCRPSGPTDDVRHGIAADALHARTIALAAAACLHLQPNVTDLRPDSAEIIAQFESVMRGARQQFDELDASPGLCLAANATAADVLVLSLATTDGKNKHAFMAGLMQSREGRFVLDQYLASGPDEEPAVLQAVCDRLAEPPLVVTFDSRPGDLAVFRRRADACGISLPDRLPRNLNLRADLRKRMTGRLRSFSLNALEQVLTGYRRGDRVDRRAFGKIYQHFLATGETQPLQRAIACQQVDLLTMIALLTNLLTGTEPYLD